MSETQTILQSSKDEDAQQNNAQNDDRRGSQANNDSRRGSQQANTQSPIKSILSRAASLTQRSQKSNRNSVSEKEVEEIIDDATTSNILEKSRFIDDGLHPGRIIAEVIESPIHKRNPPSDVNPQQSQNSPTRQGKGQQILFQENGHTISVRIEGKFLLFITIMNHIVFTN